jgi:hypothetical protein
LTATTRIDAELLVPGGGAPVTASTVLLDGTMIEYAGARSDLPPEASVEPSLWVPVLMAGMCDCHCHLHGIRRSAWATCS